MKPLRRSIPPPSGTSRRRSISWCATGPRSSSRTDSRLWSTPIRSWCCAMAASWNMARTRTCWHTAGFTRNCTASSSMPDEPLGARLQALWYRAAPPPLALRALSWAYGGGVRARRAGYARGWLRSQRLERPVIVVGNLSVGGSGKTPLVIWLALQLRAAGFVPGIVLRGHGGSASRGHESVRVLVDSDPALVGDEALLLCRRTGEPVVIVRDRGRSRGMLLDGRSD